MITNVETIYEFRNNSNSVTCGLYKVKLIRSTYYFIRNGQSLGAIHHLLGHTAWECVHPVGDDVKAELFKMLDEKREKTNDI